MSFVSLYVALIIPINVNVDHPQCVVIFVLLVMFCVQVRLNLSLFPHLLERETPIRSSSRAL